MELNKFYRLKIDSIPIIPLPTSPKKIYSLLKNDIIQFIGYHEDMGVELNIGEISGIKFLFNPSDEEKFIQINLKHI
jgi:hypothetical protein